MLEEVQEKVFDRIPFLRSTRKPAVQSVPQFALQEGHGD